MTGMTFILTNLFKTLFWFNLLFHTTLCVCVCNLKAHSNENYVVDVFNKFLWYFSHDEKF